ncbi:MAG: ATP-binding protein [Candidatus Zixiibacteriota bacterium]
MKKPIIAGNTITIPSDAEYLTDVDVFIEGILRGWGVDESTLADIAISVSELVNNAIHHGNKLAADKNVFVTISREHNIARIAVKDQGMGFDPTRVADPLAEENILHDAGRGIFIINALMDKVDVDATDNGTTVTITKTFT